MLSTTRSVRSIDQARLSSLAAAPGVDSRVNLTLAIVTAFHVEADGVFCDVLLMPSEDTETVRMGAAYSGAGWGLYAPLHVDDEVLVGFPNGDPNEGGIILARLWSAADKVPSAGVDNNYDVVLQVEPMQSVRILANDASIIVDGDGNIALTSKDGAKAELTGKNVTATAAAPDGVAQITATAVTGEVKLGPVGTLQVIVLGALDGLGIPITQAPAAVLSIVKAG